MPYYPNGAPQQPRHAPRRAPRPNPQPHKPRHPDGRKGPRRRRWPIVLAILLIVIGVLYAMGGTSKLPSYQTVSSSVYARDGFQGMAYRVALDPSVTNNQLIAVFKNVTKNDR